MASVRQRWFIVGFYLALDDMDIIKHVVTSIGQLPHGDALLVEGYFNMGIATLECSNQGEEITAYIATAGLDYMSTHFLPRRKSWSQDRIMW